MKTHIGKVLWLVILFIMHSSHAGTHVWSGAVDGFWSNAANWSSGGAPLNGEASLHLVFPAGATRLTITNNVGNLSLETMNIQGSGYTIHGSGVGTNLFVANAGTIYSSGLANELGATINLNVTGYGTFQIAFDSALTVSSKIIGLGNPVYKTGKGTLTFSSATENSYVGSTVVSEGTLRLENGFPFFSSWLSSIAIPGTLVIGSANMSESAKVILLQGNQIATNASITINANGALDLNGNLNKVGAVTLSGGSIMTGAGKLTLDGDLTSNFSASTNAVISGNLSLGEETRTFNIAGGQLTISANISDDIDGRGIAGIAKTGTGKLILSGNNTFTGSTTVSAGVLRPASAQSLGTTNYGTIISSGAQLDLSNITVANEPLTVSGTGTNATSGAVVMVGACAWGGPISLPADATFHVAVSPDFADFSGVISGPGGFKKTGGGAINLIGSQPNTFSGQTTVFGKLRLSKSAGVQCIAGPLVIGDGIGNSMTNEVAILAAAQINENSPVTINSSGQLLLGVNNQALSLINMAGGRIDASTGTLQISGTVNSFDTPVGGGSILCKVSLGGNLKTFNVAYGGDLFIYGVMSDLGFGGGIQKVGGGPLVLLGNNTYAGLTMVNEGELVIYNLNALGSWSVGTVVQGGAALSMYNIGDCMEPLTLNGNGTGIFKNALNAYGTNLITGQIVCDTDTSIRTPSATDKLSISAVVTGTGILTKGGSGTVEFGGVSDNGIPAVVVHAGQLELKKGSGAVAIPGSLTVGNDLDPVNSATVLFEGHNQIDNNSPITIRKSGRLSLAGFVDTIGSLHFTGGKVETGAGLLTLNGNVSMSNAVTFATIDGKLSLGAQTRTFDLDGNLGVNAVISGTVTSAGVTKTGNGMLSLTAENTYSGQTTVNAGTLQLSNNGRPGSMTAGTTVNAGGAIYLYNAGIVSGEPLTIEGAGHDGAGALRGLGANTWTASVELSGSTTINVFNSGDQLTLSSVISGNGNVTKVGSGRLTFSGNAPNTYNGITFVNLGTLGLSKVAGVNAVPSTLHVGEDIEEAFTGVVEVLAASQIPDSATIYLHQSGYFKLSSGNESIGPLNMKGGRVESFGNTLTLLGGVTVEPSTVSVATISGVLSLNSGTRIINVLTNAQLDIESTIINGNASPGGLQKKGPGQLELLSWNLFTGPMIVAEGTLLARHEQAFGTFDSGVTISNGAQLLLDYNLHFGQEPLSIAGSGSGFASLAVFGTNSWAGPITLLSQASFGIVGGNSRLHLTGAMTGPGGFVKQGQGKLQLEGTATNTYLGSTHILQGVLALTRTNIASIPSTLQVGSGALVSVMRPEQIGNNADVTVDAFGTLELLNNPETIGSLSGAGYVSLGTATLTTGGNNNSTTFTGVLTGNAQPFQANLLKTGTGTFTLGGANTFTGETMILGGKLIMNGSQPGTVQLMNGSTLGGSGSVGTIMALNGTIAPGNSPGALACSNLYYGFTGGLAIELNGTNAITQYDQVHVSGDVNLNGTLNVSLNFPSAVSNEFVIIKRTGTDPVSGQFTDLAEGATFNVKGRTFRISYAAGDGNDVTLKQLTQPQPANIANLFRYLDGHVEVVGTGEAGIQYRLEANADLNTTNWVNLGTFTATGAGQIFGSDFDANGYPQRFYRLVVP